METEQHSPDPGDRLEQISVRADTNLQLLVSLITDRYRISRITCFGCQHPYREFSRPDDHGGTWNHYFILLETMELYAESVIQDYLNNRFTCGKVFVLAHHHGKVREMLEAGHRFYCQVRRSGVLLFTDEPDTVPHTFSVSKNWLERAGEHFKTHFGMSRSFLDGAAAQLETGQPRIALFLLHQTMEQACIGLIRVFLGYRANFHNLGRLLELCSCFIRPPFSLFPANTEGEQRQFRMLCRSYTDARYREDFTIHAEDCRDILKAVGAFAKQSEEICLNRLPVLSEYLTLIWIRPCSYEPNR
ncbi:MAG TPA: HEPN domain-containing protein [Sphingobacteriaceae bacterium]